MNIDINDTTYMAENISPITIAIDFETYQWNNFQIFGIEETDNIKRTGVINIKNQNFDNKTYKIIYNDYVIIKNNIIFKVVYAEVV